MQVVSVRHHYFLVFPYIMVTSLDKSENKVQIDHLFPKRFISFGENIAKIGPVDPEIIVLRAIIKNRDQNEKKKEINASKCIALLASLPSGIN